MVDERLGMLLELAGSGTRLADVGSDHGYLVIEALTSGRWQQGIATDISPAAVEKTRRAARLAGLETRIDCRQGDGLEPLAAGEAEAAVIAGMGGPTIAQILARGFPVSRAVLQPMKDVAALRAFLLENGFCIREEALARAAGRWYHGLLVEPGAEPERSPLEVRVGWRLLERRHPLLRPWLAFRIGQMERWVNKTRPDSDQARAYIASLEAEIRRWRDLYERL